MNGAYIALMGIDGVGKTTLAKELADLARAAGRDVRLVSWRSYLESSRSREYPREQLERLWVQSFRQYFGGATTPDGVPIDLPTSFEDLNRRGGTEYLNGAKTVGIHGTAMMSAAWIELSANTILHRSVIRPLVADGCIVIQESFGFKHLVKLFIMAAQVSPELTSSAAIGVDIAAAFFGQQLRPDHGIHVSADPSLALRWRMAENGRLGTFESLDVVGNQAASSFLRVQTESAARFAAFAASHDWIRVDVIDDDRAINRRRALRTLAETSIAAHLGIPAEEN